ncbi:DNA alkylation repair enzyme [Fibrella aestuarina BUZ 2]|uniref:DNA alkylation repair enzyme n=1 Tax=Fibrella aestuarina BUZ 2 TaxID=1166018 RepID=I0K465_9BACT|nr:DNA alkylation repair protein [Fibrella aestuarina]CCG98918.1 DNA alkylation repair enzyme [Fibrella aestuarina BUZ 2]
MTPDYQTVRQTILAQEQPERAAFAARYFKTQAGQYGEGDVFLGLSMPQQHALARQFRNLAIADTEQLVQDPYHECRMVGLLIWNLQAKRGGTVLRQALADRYVANRQFINNWDLVDSSCPTLLGLPLLTADRTLLYELAQQDHLWSQRIALVTTWQFIRHGQFSDTFALVEQLITHRHDLIHKAMGWMLREVGKRNLDALNEFLHDHARQLPRTALRYALERHDPVSRRAFMAK